MFGQSTREIALEARKGLQDHIDSCSRATQATQAAIKGLDDKVAKLIWMVIAALAAIAFDLLKSKGVL